MPERQARAEEGVGSGQRSRDDLNERGSQTPEQLEKEDPKGIDICSDSPAGSGGGGGGEG